MDIEKTKQCLYHENSRLLNNFNILRELLLTYQEKLKPSRISDELRQILQQCVVKYNDTPLTNDKDSFCSQSEHIEYLKSRNSGLHRLIHNLFDDLLAIERHLYSAHIQNICDLKTEDLTEEILEGEDANTELENEAMISKMRDLQRLERELEEEEKLEIVNENMIKDMDEERDDLKEKVKELQEKLEERSTHNDKTARYLEEKEKWDIEKIELEKIMKVITLHIYDAKYNANDQEEELMRTIKLQSIYKNVIKSFLKDTEKICKTILTNTDKLRKPSLCQRVSVFFCPTWKRNEKKMRFLLKEKFKATNEAEELKTKSKRAEHKLNIFRAIVDAQQKELGIIHKRMESHDEKMLEYRPSFCKRMINFFCGRWTGNADNIFHRQKHKSTTMAETLDKKLEEMQKLQYFYEILTEKIDDKIVRLDEKVELINEELLRLHNHPLMAKELVKVLNETSGVVNSSNVNNILPC